MENRNVDHYKHRIEGTNKDGLLDRLDILMNNNDTGRQESELNLSENYYYRQTVVLANKINRHFLLIVTSICGISLYYSKEADGLDKQPTSTLTCESKLDLIKEDNQGPLSEISITRPTLRPKEKTRPPAWTRQHCYISNVVLCLYLYCSIRILVNIILQYQHDYYVVRLRLANRTSSVWPHDKSSNKYHMIFNQETLSHLYRSMDSTRWRLKAVGAPHIDACMVAESAYITLLLLGQVSYVQGSLYFGYICPFDFQLMRTFADRKMEQKNCQQMILDEMGRIIESSRMFTLCCIEKCKHLSSIQQHQLNLSSYKQNLMFNHRLMMKQMNLLLQSGRLWPANRQDHWLDTLALVYCAISFGCLVWSIFFDIAFYHYLPQLANFNIESQWPMDYLVDCEIIILCVIIVAALILYQTTSMICCADQIKLVAEVSKLTRSCAQFNRLEYLRLVKRHDEQTKRRGRLKTSTSTPDRCLFTQINSNLLLVLMHYKMFVGQLRPIQRPIGYISLNAIFTMLWHPTLIRLHSPYVQSLDLKANYYILSLITAVFVNFSVGPICYLNSRCRDLYKLLGNLLAHTIETDMSSPFDRDVYEPHTVWLLRKELNYPDRSLKQFETKSCGLTITYSNLVKVYFWTGLILLSISNDTKSGTPNPGAQAASGQVPVFGSRILDDPFGFFKTT